MIESKGMQVHLVNTDDFETVKSKYMEIAVRKGKKALRLDLLKSNLPAQKMYEKASKAADMPA